MPLAKVQKICSASSLESGASAAELTRTVASLGAGGLHTRNIGRDFSRLIRRNLQMYIEPSYLEVPTSHGVVRWPILAPHESIAKLGELNLVNKVILGNLNVSEFWGRLAQDPCLAPATVAAMKEAAVLGSLPLRIHGDEGQWLGRDRGILVLSLSGYVHSTHPYDSRVLVTVWELEIVGHVWSFLLLWCWWWWCCCWCSLCFWHCWCCRDV
jgi:hypothetical protein